MVLLTLAVAFACVFTCFWVTIMAMGLATVSWWCSRAKAHQTSRGPDNDKAGSSSQREAAAVGLVNSTLDVLRHVYLAAYVLACGCFTCCAALPVGCAMYVTGCLFLLAAVAYKALQLCWTLTCGCLKAVAFTAVVFLCCAGLMTYCGCVLAWLCFWVMGYRGPRPNGSKLLKTLVAMWMFDRVTGLSTAHNWTADTTPSTPCSEPNTPRAPATSQAAASRVCSNDPTPALASLGVGRVLSEADATAALPSCDAHRTPCGTRSGSKAAAAGSANVSGVTAEGGFTNNNRLSDDCLQCYSRDVDQDVQGPDGNITTPPEINHWSRWQLCGDEASKATPASASALGRLKGTKTTPASVSGASTPTSTQATQDSRTIKSIRGNAAAGPGLKRGPVLLPALRPSLAAPAARVPRPLPRTAAAGAVVAATASLRSLRGYSSSSNSSSSSSSSRGVGFSLCRAFMQGTVGFVESEVHLVEARVAGTASPALQPSSGAAAAAAAAAAGGSGLQHVSMNPLPVAVSDVGFAGAIARCGEVAEGLRGLLSLCQTLHYEQGKLAADLKFVAQYLASRQG